MAEKARYYLEQMVPELEDLQNKGLFDKKEITMIMRRRTDFEYRIQGRGRSPNDFLKYCEFECNLEKLRKKRYKRLSSVGLVNTKPSISDWAGVRRVMFIFERATRRFPADLSLWSNYLNFAKDNGAVKVVYKVYSRLLQMQPRNVDAWISAAKYEFETNANAKGARVMLQKGLRFNSDSFELWLAYAQMELNYISKLLARRKVLGLLTEEQQKDEMQKQEEKFNKIMGADDEEDFRKDLIEFKSTSDEIENELNSLPEADMNMLGNPDTNPALKGDVVLTIFDVCVPSVLKNMPESVTIVSKKDRAFSIANAFLNLFEKYTDLNRTYMSLHIIQYLQNNYGDDLRSTLNDITLSLRFVELEDLAEALQLAANKFSAYKIKLINRKEKDDLTRLFVQYLKDRFLNNEKIEISSRVRYLLESIINKCNSI